jgi:hypothetical protein
MRRSLGKFSESEASNHTLSLADFTTTTPKLKFSVHTGARVQLDLILLPHDSREMDLSTNRFHHSGCRLYSAHMKEAGGRPGLEFGDPFAD